MKRTLDKFKERKHLRDVSIFFLGVGIMFLIINIITINTAYVVTSGNLFFNHLISMAFSLVSSMFIIAMSAYLYRLLD